MRIRKREINFYESYYPNKLSLRLFDRLKHSPFDKDKWFCNILTDSDKYENI
jgi:hypothetical protein